MLNPADAAFARHLSAVVPADTLRQPAPRHLEDPRGRFTGRGGLLATPRSTEQVAALIRACANARVGIIPFGGGTGLVAGQIHTDGPAPLILSLERMDKIRALNTDESVLVAEAGVTVQAAEDAAKDAGLLFALSIASRGSARIGGVLSTNAGGAGTIRYGNARALCLGLEAVLPNGDIWHGLTPLRKDNLGYDLRDLLIGAEGTLGVITAASLCLHPRPKHRQTALFAIPDPAAGLSLLNRARDRFAGSVSVFELMHRQGFGFIAETMPDVRAPFATPPEWVVLVETGMSAATGPEMTLERLWQDAERDGLVLDGWLARSGAQQRQFRALREALPEANRRIGAICSHDVSVPLAAIAGFIARAGRAVRGIGDFRINCFGHVGDGNLHYNVFPARGLQRGAFTAQREAISRAVHDLVHELGGSVAAEHGVGRLKTRELERYGDPAKVAAMRAIKAALDPAGVMNPGAVLPG